MQNDQTWHHFIARPIGEKIYWSGVVKPYTKSTEQENLE